MKSGIISTPAARRKSPHVFLRLIWTAATRRRLVWRKRGGNRNRARPPPPNTNDLVWRSRGRRVKCGPMSASLESPTALATAEPAGDALGVRLAGTWQITDPRPSWNALLAGRSPTRVRLEIEAV